jgi:hypothetical protein
MGVDMEKEREDWDLLLAAFGGVVNQEVDHYIAQRRLEQHTHCQSWKIARRDRIYVRGVGIVSEEVSCFFRPQVRPQSRTRVAHGHKTTRM